MPVKMKEVYAITERANQEKSYWARIGVAFVNRDDSLNVILDAVPVNGRLHIRDKSPYAEKKSQPETYKLKELTEGGFHETLA